MKIIDKETGKRVDQELRNSNSALKSTDPILRNAEKDMDMEENSPMDPPDPYGGAVIEDVSYEDYSPVIKKFFDEHKVANSKLEQFEKALVDFKEFGYKLNEDINKGFGEFFDFFDNKILDHNQREEKVLFPLLHQRLIESGEHGEGAEPRTAVDIMEDDHIKFIQLGALTFNFLGLAPRLKDLDSRMFVYDTAYDTGRELIEMLKLHIYREENILFPLAHKVLSKKDFESIEA